LKHPVTGLDCPVPAFGFRNTPETLGNLIDENLIIFGDDHTTMPRRKTFLKDTSDSQMPTVFKSGSRGKGDLDQLGFEFTFAHPVEFYRYILDASAEENGIIFDFFGGSGTTAHAVISLNRDDGAQRKYVLVEMGQHFDSVMVPRVKKVVYSKDWKDGKPLSQEGSSHAFKYIRLESYEDALDNIAFDEPSDQTTLQLDDYVVNYMLDFETRDSGTLLNVKMLDSPFDYKLRRHGKDEPLAVDVAETFNYLIGLHVTSRRALDNNNLRYLVYRGKAEGHETVIIWRTTRGWKEKEFELDRQFILDQRLIEGAEDIFVNTDSFVEGARSLDPVFKRRMFNEE
jgi:adenine-specific DNA-methyltransferase